MELIICYLLTAFGFFLFIKNIIVYKNTMKILDAIHSFNMSELRRLALIGDVNSFKPIPYDCMESYIKAVFSLRYWTCGSLVSSDVLNKIDIYI